MQTKGKTATRFTVFVVLAIVALLLIPSDEYALLGVGVAALAAAAVI